MANFGLLTGERISESEVLFKWRVLESSMSRANYFYTSMDLGLVDEQFSQCRLKFKRRIATYGNQYSFLFSVSDDFLSKCKAILLEFIMSDFNGKRFVTKHLKQYPKLFFQGKEISIMNEYTLDLNEFEIVFDIRFRGVLSLPCLIQSCDTTSQVEKIEQERSLKNHSALIQDITNLFTKSDMCDTTIHIAEEIIPVHKIVLAARSPVFKKMFEHECEESKTMRITITDCDKEVFKKFLNYLYSGELEGNLSTVLALYTIADKYNVQSLQESCSQIIQEKFNSEGVESMANSVCEILELAYYLNDQVLKDIATNFIAHNLAVVSRKKSWKDLLKNNVNLTCPVIVAAVLSQKIN